MTFKSVAQRVAQRAQEPDAVAYVYLADGVNEKANLSWHALHENALRRAVQLQRIAAVSSRVLLALPTGLQFIEVLFACWYANMIPVPISLPRQRNARHRLQAIVDDAEPSVIICDDLDFDLNTQGQRIIRNTEHIARVVIDEQLRADTFTGFSIDHKPKDIGLLQYTSGSTGMPRGVQVTHANLVHNSQLIAQACDLNTSDTLVGWLPLYHDMGLIGSVIQTAWTGARLVFMAPERFLMHPIRWLQSINRYQATVTGAPNSAFDLCAQRITEQQKLGLDLSSLRCSLNGSEPVRLSSIERFERAFSSCGFCAKSWRVCYGLAEATLLVSMASEIDVDGDNNVSCGRAVGDQTIAIVDPITCTRMPSKGVGEIWLKGPSCASGYWRNVEETNNVFAAHIVDESGSWLRTGDLGYLSDGQLFVTDRLKDLIIVSGRNHSPLDIEETVGQSDPALSPNTCAAFAVDNGGGETLVVVAELQRSAFQRLTKRTTPIDIDNLIKTVSQQVAAAHGITPKKVIVTPPGAIPRTTSGKIQRNRCREAYLEGTLARVDDVI